MRIALFITCLADGFFPRAGIAVVRVLEHLGHEVGFPSAQTCCGQPLFNAGHRDDARALAQRMLEIFEGWPLVITPSGSCAAMVRAHFAELFPDGSAARAAAQRLAGRTREFAEALLSPLGVDLREHAARWPGTVAVHESCHARELGVGAATVRLLGQIDGLDVRSMPSADTCCGFGGAFAVRFPSISEKMVDAKLADIRALHPSAPRTIVSTDAGCTMHIAGACRRHDLDARFLSAAEIVAESLGLLDPAEAVA